MMPSTNGLLSRSPGTCSWRLPSPQQRLGVTQVCSNKSRKTFGFIKGREQHGYWLQGAMSNKRSRPVQKTFASPQGVGLFPAGQQQAKVKLPALFLMVTVSDVLREEVLSIISSGIKGGVTGVLLSEDPQAGTSGGDLYNAALKLQEVIRERAALIIVDRADIADACNASGVLLSPGGLPIAVAQRSLKGGAVLVGQMVKSSEDARKAASEGANLVVVCSEDGSPVDKDLISNSKIEQKGGSIPVIAQFSSAPETDMGSLLNAAPDGLSLHCSSLASAAKACGAAGDIEPDEAAELILKALSQKQVEGVAVSPVKTGRKFMSKKRETLITEEKGLIERILSMLGDVSPGMEEIGLLDDAMMQLDELFLVVVVGEFNSGKSSVINALLGGNFLEEGFLPTTNEISILRYTTGSPRSQTDADGMVEKFLPADLLREVNIVDTPGTNVVLQRQQRLTEEYVPRADMVLFVMSADRPFTESEVNFLKYIRRWGKKVVFVVNKVDILSSSSDVDEVRAFVGDNAKELLNLDEAFVWPVSARSAVQAKVSNSAVEGNPAWEASRFRDLETFIVGFLSGETGAFSGESVRLKLQTPLLVADALMDACRRQLENELDAAKKDLGAVRSVRRQLEKFRSDMVKDSVVQRRAARDLLDKVVARTEGFVDNTLQLSNLQTLRGYLSSDGNTDTPQVSKGFGSVAMGSIVDDLKQVIDEHDSWLAKNFENQVNNYTAFAERCVQQKGMALDQVMNDYKQSGLGDVSEKQVDAAKPDADDSVAAIVQKVMCSPELGVELCERLIEGEIRDAVNATAGTAFAAVGIGFVLTLILPYTSEDFLAVALSLVVGYVALLNLPLRRGEVKGKVRMVASEVFNEVDGGMDKRLQAGLDQCNSEVLTMIAPLEVIFEEDVKKIENAEVARAQLVSELNSFKSRIANIE